MRRPSLMTGVLVLVACSAGPDEPPLSPPQEAFLEARLIYDEPGPGREAVDYEGGIIYLAPRPTMADPDFLSVEPHIPSPGDLHFDVALKPEVVERVRSEMTRAVGMRIALVVDGRVLNAPEIRDAVGPTMVVGGFDVTAEEAERLAAVARNRWPEPNRR